MTTEELDRIAEFFIWNRPDEILRIVYGDEQSEHYLNEKMKLLKAGPFCWYKTLDRDSRQRLVDAAFA